MRLAAVLVVLGTTACTLLPIREAECLEAFAHIERIERNEYSGRPCALAGVLFGSTAECQAATSQLRDALGTDPDVFVGQCTRAFTRDQLTCIHASDSVVELMQCY